jgi:WD40 repeat protein
VASSRHQDDSPIRCGVVIATGVECVGCEAKLFDRRTGRKVVEVQVGRQAVTDCVFLRGPGLRAATATKDAVVKVWDLEAIMASVSDAALSDTLTDLGLLAQTELDQAESVHSLASGPDQQQGQKQLLATGHVNGRGSVWEVDLAKKQLTLQMHAPGTSD